MLGWWKCKKHALRIGFEMVLFKYDSCKEMFMISLKVIDNERNMYSMVASTS